VSAVELDQIALARRQVLQARLARRRTAGAAPVQIPRRTDSGPAPLSAAQLQLWYLSQLAPDSVAYNELVTIRKDGEFDHAAFEWAFNEVIRRHEAWRTTFVVSGDEPRQVVHPHRSIALPVTDLSHLPFADAETTAARRAAEIASQPYDLARGPILRPLLVRLSPTHHRLYLAMHHLIFDGVSLYRIVLPEMVALYDAHRAGLPSPLPEAPIQYSDYADWERGWIESPEVERRLERCRERLQGVAPADLPADKPRPARQRFRGSMLPLTIEASTAQRLKDIGAENGATLFQVLASVYSYWLRSYTENDDVVFATAHDLRQAPELEAMVGYCLTPVVLRIPVSPNVTCAQLLEAMRAEVPDALGCAVPFERLVQAIDPPRDQRRNPLFQTAIVLEPPMDSPDPDWSIHQMETAVGQLVSQSKFDVSIELDERRDGRIDGRLIFNTDLFSTDTAAGMVAHFQRLVRNAAVAPETPLAELSRPDEAERHRLLTEFNPPPPTQVAATECVHELIAAQAARTPDAIAVAVGERQMTYRELLRQARRIAARLADAGAGPGSVVAVRLERSATTVPALLGVLLCGAAYLPMDPHAPESRSLYMIDDAGATVVLADATAPALATPDGVTTVVLGPADAAPEVAPLFRPVACDPGDLAYILYTSGSTGRPKGVQVEHASVVNLMTALPVMLDMSDADTVVSVASTTFDVSFGDIVCTLGVGGTLLLATEAQIKDPHALAEVIETRCATMMFATPTTWSMLIAAGWDGRSGLLAACVGEPLPDHLAAELRTRCWAVWNGWGPTEATVYAGGGFVEDGEPVTVGTPLPGDRVYVMDADERLLPCGVPGEIVIAGRGVSRGYVNRPEETAQRYRRDPFFAGERMYCTGDRGRLLADGRLQHLGRYDTQVKIRGYRVELGEVESVLVEHPQIKEVAVDVRGDDVTGPQLVAYLVAENDGPSDAEVRRWARGRLPAYMVPSTIVAVPALPMSASAKLNRAALPDPPQRAQRSPAEAAPASSATDQRLAELWAELLPGANSDPDADFFDLGGHSVLATRLLADIQRRLGVTITVADFLEHGTTLAGLARLVDAGGTPVALQAVPDLPRLFFVYPDLASSMSLRHLSQLHEHDNRLYPLIPALHGRFGRPRTLDEVAEPLLHSIRQAQPHGPYRLIGYSFGGLLAYQLAGMLRRDGEQVDWLSLVDTPTPQAVRALIRQWKSASGRMARLRESGRARLVADYLRNAGWAAREKLIASGLLTRAEGEQFDIRHAWKIMLDCDPQAHDVPVDLFVTADTIDLTGDQSLGWAQQHQGPLDIRSAPGDHDSLLSETFAAEFTALVSASLQHSSTPSQNPVAAKEFTL